MFWKSTKKSPFKYSYLDGSILQVALQITIRDYRHAEEAHVWFSGVIYLLHGRMLSFHCDGVWISSRILKEDKNQVEKMKKVGLIGVLLITQVSKRRVIIYIYIYILYHNFFHCFFFSQAKLSLGCHPHFNLVKDEEKCLKDLILFKSNQSTGRENQFLNCFPLLYF